MHSPVFLDVEVTEDDDLPDAVALRFKTIGETEAVHSLAYDDGDGHRGWWDVATRHPTTPDDRVVRTVLVEDSSEGTARLFLGGAHGLTLRHQTSGFTRAEAYLVLATTSEWRAA